MIIQSDQSYIKQVRFFHKTNGKNPCSQRNRTADQALASSAFEHFDSQHFIWSQVCQKVIPDHRAMSKPRAQSLWPQNKTTETKKKINKVIYYYKKQGLTHSLRTVKEGDYWHCREIPSLSGIIFSFCLAALYILRFLSAFCIMNFLMQVFLMEVFSLHLFDLNNTFS